jgi:hypothetical protein
MKNFKSFMAALIVSCALVSAPSIANPTDKKPPQTRTVAEVSFSAWLSNVFNF